MERRTFGRTGLDVSVLGFGGAPIGVLETGQAEVDGLLGLLLDHGVNLIDTAAGYRGSEEAIGRSIGVWRLELPSSVGMRRNFRYPTAVQMR